MYIVYQTKNKINGKIYVGVHNNKDQHYLGSGKYISESINFYGKDAFERTILYSDLSKEEALKIEASIVTEDFVAREDTYNLVVGGGMPPSGSGTNHSQYGTKKPKISQRMKENNPSKLPHVREYNKSTVVVRDKDGKCFRVLKNDIRIEQGILTHINKGKLPYYSGKKMPLKVCPHCNKKGAGGSMDRWHFDNCKMKGDSV